MKQQVKIPNPIWVEVKAEIAHTVLLDFIDDAAHFADGIDERGNATSYYSEEGQDCFNKLYDMVEETMLNCGMVDEDQAEKSPDPEPEIVRAGSLLSSPSFLCIFDGDRAEIHTAASFAKAYPDYSEVISSLEQFSAENSIALQISVRGSRPVFTFREGQIKIERVI
jgi:hypothetical protein